MSKGPTEPIWRHINRWREQRQFGPQLAPIPREPCVGARSVRSTGGLPWSRSRKRSNFRVLNDETSAIEEPGNVRKRPSGARGSTFTLVKLALTRTNRLLGISSTRTRQLSCDGPSETVSSNNAPIMRVQYDSHQPGHLLRAR